MKDPLGNVTLTQYDTNDNAHILTDPLNNQTVLTYDGNGNLTNVALPNSGNIGVQYDSRNRPHMRTDALGQSESWTYDGMDGVLTHIDRKSQETQFEYDAMHRLSLITYADGSTIVPTFDLGNRLTAVTDSMAGDMSWVYDGLNDLTSETSSQGTVSYQYDLARRLISMTAGAQAIANYSYDNANRFTGVTQGSEAVSVVYDNANRRKTLTLPNGVVVTYGFDNANELTSLSYAQNGTTTLGTLAYGYDNDGRRINKTGSFATDLQPLTTTQNGVFDSNNRQTSFSGATLQYDANGNLTNSGAETYTWNARNQLTQISDGSTIAMSFTYDSLGRRTSKTVGTGAPTQYLYDGMNIAQETESGTTNPILLGVGADERFARNDIDGRAYFLTDALNSTVALTSTTGTVQNLYSYDPYGNASETSEGFTNPYQYAGREADTAGLYYYRARYYSPAMGRFISEDPLWFDGGQNNFYSYVAGDPINYLDQYGLDANTWTYGEIEQWSITSMRDFTPPPGLADAKASIAAACGRNTNVANCKSVDGSNATAPADAAAWNNIVNANGGSDLTGGGDLMCVGTTGCWFVHASYTCRNHSKVLAERDNPLTPTGTVSVNGHTLYFYSDPLGGWDNATDRNTACHCLGGTR
jgi:RHS repeat-associated protein